MNYNIRNFKIESFDKNKKPGAGPCIIQSPAVGVAIEYFLAIHGMTSYHRIVVTETTDDADESYGRLSELMFRNLNSDAIIEKVKELDEHHFWEIK